MKDEVVEELERQNATLDSLSEWLQRDPAVSLIDLSNQLHDIKELLEEISGKL